ncbi:MAG: hypothetical protein ACFFB2_02710 [Promethearchaeota archaeon]
MHLDDSFKKCLFLLASNDGFVDFCLQFKLWNESCPPHCDQFVSGELGNIKEAEFAGYDVECLDFTRKIKRNQPVYYCKLYEQDNPLCRDCRFHRYSANPSNPD